MTPLSRDSSFSERCCLECWTYWQRLSRITATLLSKYYWPKLIKFSVNLPRPLLPYVPRSNWLLTQRSCVGEFAIDIFERFNTDSVSIIHPNAISVISNLAVGWDFPKASCHPLTKYALNSRALFIQGCEWSPSSANNLSFPIHWKCLPISQSSILLIKDRSVLCRHISI